ncbi:Methyltransferase domain-containing protein [Cyclobacterium xiamenense]|uniref:Methyltransferase domain-containing protein n=1 Tax=Cyclobacterium xiamenense TaxID=1297121 RepID=A0A1H6WLZ6_9BACT|nr:class I SAM-dependent methyltransferase [Cyclobacterium xiamenense]SEJ13790.1 Methyltransferase domain-containing protein [Cyclobacterium xiamenense]
MEIKALNNLLGNIDIYLLDQLLKGRFEKDMLLLDAGCGEGRNSHYFIRGGYQILGVDSNPTAIQMARITAKTLDPTFDAQRFIVAPVEDLPFHRGAFDALISSAVMHFARDRVHFDAMFGEQMRVLKKGGLFWLRMCSDAGGCFPLSGDPADRQQALPDGTERFVLTEQLLSEVMKCYRLSLLEPAKSVVVHGQRAMGAYLFKKEGE